jgi:hypothetical protein
LIFSDLNKPLNFFHLFVVYRFFGGRDRSERENRQYQAALAETADARTKLENKQQISISDAARLLNVSPSGLT